MNIFKIPGALIGALQAGKELAHVASWKHAQAITGGVLAVVSVLKAAGIQIEINQDLAVSIGESVAGVFCAYLAYATDSRVGLAKTSDPPAPPGADRLPGPTPPVPLDPSADYHRTDIPDVLDRG